MIEGCDSTNYDSNFYICEYMDLGIIPNMGEIKVIERRGGIDNSCYVDPGTKRHPEC